MVHMGWSRCIVIKWVPCIRSDKYISIIKRYIEILKYFEFESCINVSMTQVIICTHSSNKIFNTLFNKFFYFWYCCEYAKVRLLLSENNNICMFVLMCLQVFYECSINVCYKVYKFYCNTYKANLDCNFPSRA